MNYLKSDIFLPGNVLIWPIMSGHGCLVNELTSATYKLQQMNKQNGSINLSFNQVITIKNITVRA